MQGLLTRDGCLRRQERLRRLMETRGWDLFLTGSCRTVYSLTGALLSPEVPTAFALTLDGRSVLVSPVSQAEAAAECLTVETYSIDRVIVDPVPDAARLLAGHLTKWQPRRCGVEWSHTPSALAQTVARFECEDAGPTVRALRKRKEDDEVAEIRRSLRLSEVAYDAARAAIRPGLTEIDVHNAMYDAVVREAGGTVEFAGDFACGVRAIRGGGPPTARTIEAGDLYILDLFPAPAFYYGDTCRVFCAGEPTDAQMRAWELVTRALRLAEQAARPGVEGREVYRAVKEFLDGADPIAGGSFWHHAGHGVGCQGHEAPRLIPASSDLIEPGDVIAMEPGVYSETLRGGIRLENTYRVREDGLENLFEYPLGMR